ncbi:MAG TPA: hypothetical protein VGI61_06460 [Parafilimonas sp.]|jgi:hypothetical protein
MKIKSISIIYFLVLFVSISFLVSCNSGSNNNSKSEADTTSKTSAKTKSLKTDTLPKDNNSDTFFSIQRFSKAALDTILITSSKFHASRVSTSVFEMNWNVKDLIQKMQSCDSIRFVILKIRHSANHIVNSLIIKTGLTPVPVALNKNKLDPEIITSTGTHGIWIRMSRLSKNELNNLIDRAGFPDIRTNSSNYQMIVTPALGQQTDPQGVLQEYVAIYVSIERINPRTPSSVGATRAHPCPYCY